MISYDTFVADPWDVPRAVALFSSKIVRVNLAPGSEISSLKSE